MLDAPGRKCIPKKKQTLDWWPRLGPMETIKNKNGTW